jgi:hypothetical protein
MIVAMVSLCSATKLTKATGEVMNGDLDGVIVLQDESATGENGLPTPRYLLCEGKHVSSVSREGVTCGDNKRVLMKVIEKPVGQAQMSVLEDAAHSFADVKDKQILMFVVPNGTKAMVMKPPSDFDPALFRLVGTLELRAGLASLSTNLIVRDGKTRTYVPVQEINDRAFTDHIQPDQRIERLVSATTVFVISVGQTAPSGVGGFLTKMATKKYVSADAESAKKDVVAAMEKSNRWTLSDSANKADLVLLVEEIDGSYGKKIVDRLWVFEGGSVPDRSSTQPLWFAQNTGDGYRSGKTLTHWLEDDVKHLLELQQQKITAVSPMDARAPDKAAKSGPQ